MTASKTSAIGSFADVPLHADGAAPAAPTPEQATAAVDAAAAANGYTAEQHAALIEDLLAAPPAERPLVAFYAATNWTTDVDGLTAAMEPLKGEGVRFLTPGEARACLEVGP